MHLVRPRRIFVQTTELACSRALGMLLPVLTSRVHPCMQRVHARVSAIRCQALNQPYDWLSRRQLALAALLLGTASFCDNAAHADGILDGVAKQLTRPDNVTPMMATVQLMDAASALKQVQVRLC